MYGIPFPTPATRIRELDESLQAIKLLWTEELASFEGKHYTLKDARHEPKPVQEPHPPITIGGGGEQLMLRVVAKHADMYNGPSRTPEMARHKNDVLDERCREIGRDPSTIRRSVQFYMESPDEVSTVHDRVKSFIDIGMDHILIGVPSAYYAGLVHDLAGQVREFLG